MVQGRLHGLNSSRTLIRRIWICRDSRAWWAAICGVSQSWTRLMWLSSSSSSSRICSIIRKIFQIQSVELLTFVNCYTNLDSILKSRDITLPTKVSLFKPMVFPVVMYGCESWTVKKAETEELILLNCGVGEDSWESLGLQGDPTSPS